MRARTVKWKIINVKSYEKNEKKVHNMDIYN